jgi:hypothetical protein
MEYDLYNDVGDVFGLGPVAISTDTTTSSAIIDTKGFESIVFQIMSGVITDGAYTTVLQEGDDSGLSDAAAVPAADRLGDLPTFAASDDGVSKKVGSVGKKRYIRLQIVSTGTTSGGLFSIGGVQGHAHSKPVA